MRRLIFFLFFCSILVNGQKNTFELQLNDWLRERSFDLIPLQDGKVITYGNKLKLLNTYGIEIKSLDINVNEFWSNSTRYGKKLVSYKDSTIYTTTANDNVIKMDIDLTPVDTFYFHRENAIRSIAVDSTGNFYLFYGAYADSVMVYDKNGNKILQDCLKYRPLYDYSNPPEVFISELGAILTFSKSRGISLYSSDFSRLYFKEDEDIISVSNYAGLEYLLQYNDHFRVIGSNGDVNRVIIPGFAVDSIYCSGYYDGKIAFYCKSEGKRGFGLIDENMNSTFKPGGSAIYSHLVFNGDVYAYQNEKYPYWIIKTKEDGLYGFLQIINDLSDVSPGDSVTVKWNTNLTGNIFRIELIDENGVKQKTIGKAVAEDRSFSWLFGDEYLSNYRIKVIDENDNNRYAETSISSVPYYATQFIDANEVIMWVGANGMGSHDPETDGSGFYWPRNEDTGINNGYMNTSIYADGALFGFLNNGEVNVHGATYNYGLTPGKINDDGTVTANGNRRYGIYKMFRDNENITDANKLAEYQYFLENYPVNDGAPWIDNDGDGYYDSAIDEPDIPGKQLLWWTSTATDPDRTRNLYASSPDNLEVHTYVYDIDIPEFKDVVFKRYKIINKSEDVYESMIFSYWSDPDLGNASDDYVGCDTSLSLAFCYNCDNYDDDYYNENPPAVGYLLVDGPDKIVGSEHKDLSMTSFVFYIGSSDVYADPDLAFPQGAIQMYNNMNGLLWDGFPFIDPNTNEPVKFALSGDPVPGTGWYEGDGWPDGPSASDRRMLMSSGQFDMEPGDTQDVTIAILMARGTSNINSLTELKELASDVNEYYKSNTIFTGIEQNSIVPPPEGFTLYQNYPNPFNPTTTIQFDLPEGGDAVLEIFDILGRRISRIERRGLNYGTHKIYFNGSCLASGVYFYRLEAGSFTDIKKMVLIK